MKKGNRDKTVKVRVTSDEEGTLKSFAEQEGLTLSEYLRRRGLKKRDTKVAEK